MTSSFNLIILYSAAITSLLMMISKKIWIKKQEVLEPEILKISKDVHKGTISFLKRQYTSSAWVIGSAFFVLLFLAYKDFISFYTPFAVLTGAFFSALSAYLGMTTATKANAVTAYYTKFGLNKSFRAALNGGAVMGFSVCGFVLLDLAIWYSVISLLSPNLPEIELMEVITSTVITFSFGTSFMAFMARVAGGIFTKAADFAADEVGKGKYNLEEDDPRNPAVVADMVGDNASDIAGGGQDTLESFSAGNAAAMEAGYQSFSSISAIFGTTIATSILVMIPLSISALGIFASIIGLAIIRTNDEKKLLSSIRRGIYSTSILVAIGSAIIIYISTNSWDLFFPIIIGLLVGNGIAWVCEYYTSTDYKPVKLLAKRAQVGHSSVVIGGTALGMMSVLSIGIILVLGMLAAFYVAGYGNYSLGIYGVSLAAVAMLSTLPITLTVDSFGPIADNAQGLIEMSGLSKERKKIGSSLDSLGNTTAATVKGYAIGSAALAAIALIGALIYTIQKSLIKFDLPTEFDLSLNNIWSISGLLLGVSVPWLFSAKLLTAVNEAATIMMKEIKHQIENLGIFEGKNKPDYKKCIDISTKAAQHYSIVPAILVIVFPILIAILGGPTMIIAFLLGSLCSGFCLAVFMSNAGGAWDNAKKYIEAGFFGGKNSSAHKAGITGDMVGDPFKDTAGPSLNILIKLMITVSILTCPVTMFLHYLIF